MEPEGSLPHLQEPAISPYSESYHSSPWPPPHPISWGSVLILSSYFRQALPSGIIPSGFPTKIIYASLLSTGMCYMLRLSKKLKEFFQNFKNLHFWLNYYSSIPLSLIFSFILSVSRFTTERSSKLQTRSTDVCNTKTFS